MGVKYVTCPHCGSEYMIQEQWTDLCCAEQHEINRIEMWRCSDCGTHTYLHAHYRMDSYTVGRNATGDLEETEFPNGAVPVEVE